MKRVTLTILPVLLAILGAIVGYVVAAVRASLFFSGALVGWQGLGTPPGIAVAVRHIEVDPDGAYVQTSTGAIWYVDPASCDTASVNCWEQVAAIPDPSSWADFEPDYQCGAITERVTEFARMKDPPGQGRICARADQSGPDGIYMEFHLAVLEDNSIWAWRHGYSKYSALYACTHVPLALLAGFLLGLWLRRHLRRAGNRAPAPVT